LRWGLPLLAFGDSELRCDHLCLWNNEIASVLLRNFELLSLLLDPALAP